MKKKLNYYKFVEIKLLEDGFYYKDLIREFQVHLKVHSNIWKVKEVCMKNLKEILNSQVLNFINFGKDYIKDLNLIKDLNVLFNF